mmetsp:Transcript_13625/g.23958  ORF Transcript_13625/g.23958 Transcript_13625/m.23958 type:complete len:87 (+) Transcript_13625:512-772(+)
MLQRCLANGQLFKRAVLPSPGLFLVGLWSAAAGAGGDAWLVINAWRHYSGRGKHMRWCKWFLLFMCCIRGACFLQFPCPSFELDAS